jgi:hypothetical protein
LAENIDAIAFHSLKDRMAKEMGEALLRLATKKLAEIEVSKENQGLGTALNIVDALSEQADTRNWQMLPFSINYTRVNLNEGKNDIELKAIGFNNRVASDSLSITTTPASKTYFHSFTSF